jgi:periplasmic protein TonB
MSYAIPIVDEFPFRRFLVYSVFLHLALCATFFIGNWLQRPGEQWGSVRGGNDNGVTVSLVPSAGIPMLQPINANDSHVVDPTKSLHNPEPLEPPPEIPPDAAKLPEFSKEKPLPPSKKSKIFERKTPEPDNVVPGKGGSPTVPTGANTPGPLNGGLTVSGPGGGDFAGRYAWYVQAVVRLISQNWMQNTIDPSVRAARQAKTVVTFTIARDGSVSNIRIESPSGNRSMDDSAQRALLSIDHFPPLPPDFSGRHVDVTFDFDLGLTR